MRLILLCLGLLIALAGFPQNKAQISTGVGLVNFGGVYGVGASSEILFPVRKSFSYGLITGYSMGSDDRINLQEAGSYNHHSIFIGDIDIRFNPKVFNSFYLALNAGGGIRHSNSTQILVNSNLEVNPTVSKDTGMGFHLGAGLFFFMNNRTSLGFHYSHDFYQEGFDFFCLKVGFTLLE
jgi:hypothetical protein